MKNLNNHMEYIEQYLEENLRIMPLGKITFAPACNGEETGNTIIIDGKDTGIEVWWMDYSTWLEKKIKLMDGFQTNKSK